MIEPVLRWPGERRGRSREVERVLARHGLLQRPHAVVAASERAAGFAARLAAALVELGPGFRAFGRYLGTRPDLFEPAAALELAALPDDGAPAPPEVVRALLAVELGRPVDEVFPRWEAAPRESRLLLQTHAARLVDDEPVLVRFVRPGAILEVERDLPLLPLLAGVFATAERPDFPLAATIDDFRAELLRAVDLAAEADDLELLAGESVEGSPLVVPRLQRGLCTTGLLVVQDLGGEPLVSDPLAEASDAPPTAASDAASHAGAPGNGDEARRLCLAWLHQALRGSVYPAEPEGRRLLRLPRRRFAFAGGPFARLPMTSQANFWGYLLAAADHDPDGAGSFLLREMLREQGGDEEGLRLRMRQAVPFRDGAWSPGGDTLAEQLFLDWRFARECGFRPRPALVPLLRGLFVVAAAAHRLAPARDALREAVEELRLIATIDRVQQGLDPRQLGPNLERYAALMLQLPQKLDDVLTRAAEGGAQQRHVEAAPPRQAPSLMLALTLAVGAVLILVGYPERASDGVAPFLAVAALGSVWLWLAARRAGRG